MRQISQEEIDKDIYYYQCEVRNSIGLKAQRKALRRLAQLLDAVAVYQESRNELTAD